MSDVCASCGDEVIWAITPAGKRAPIDRDPVVDGNVLVLQPKGLGATLAITLSQEALTAAQDARVPLRLNHFATCPDSASWAARRRAA